MHGSRYSVIPKGPPRNRSPPRAPVRSSPPYAPRALAQAAGDSNRESKSSNHRNEKNLHAEIQSSNASMPSVPIPLKTSNEGSLAVPNRSGSFCAPGLCTKQSENLTPHLQRLSRNVSDTEPGLVRQYSSPAIPQSLSYVSRQRSPSVTMDDTKTVKLQQQVEELHEQLKFFSIRLDTLSNDLEKRFTENQIATIQLCEGIDTRLTARLTELQLESNALFDAAEKSWRDQIRSLAEDRPDLNEPPELDETVVAQICDLVIHRVNADPRVCQLVESHQSLQDSFAKLLNALDKGNLATPPEEEKSRNSNDKNMLYDLMSATQKSCKSINLELRQIRQRRNQDCTDNALRFQNLEFKVKAIEGNVLHDLDPIRVLDNAQNGSTISQVGSMDECLQDAPYPPAIQIKPANGATDSGN